METLPHVREAEISLSEDELNLLRDNYRSEGAKPRPQTRFNYAWALVRSRTRPDQEEGLQLLHQMYSELPSRRRECLYYLALGEYKLQNYKNARKYNQTLLEHEPHNSQALELERIINRKIKREGFVGMAILFVTVLTVGLVTAVVVKRRQPTST
ncbi:uncharacterized protein SPPG_04617 [Spizellomyces punctatus DAOM BR117]|uniref:Mitochondrial fission 1 protein n=1 Tax=Spizellomyces punctatus (strain DAOM BR117) TaxID=645134 RepID=A0A0L0HGQ8_SPIPD|nr:uncharacterized protein SPPG_04617 [Spizellomyces punctatus DAOM BR117]KND00288.1 hypothetical protein SPPG_04617 [Spizellomyces punctatus DAOM BR117]|eukprot:XP_016608327.1 hypothetical protein SPPG_04617 [Spizellomyces punctatus DAOM BR117]